RGRERRKEDGMKEKGGGEKEDRDEVPGRFLREERDPGLMVGPRGPVLAREARLPLHDLSLHALDFHGSPQCGSATPWSQTSAMWRTISPVPTRGRMNTWIQYHRKM